MRQVTADNIACGSVGHWEHFSSVHFGLGFKLSFPSLLLEHLMLKQGFFKGIGSEGSGSQTWLTIRITWGAFGLPHHPGLYPRPVKTEPLRVGPRHQYFLSSSGNSNMQPGLRTHGS